MNLKAILLPLEIILAKKTTELVLFLNKNITKLVFLWPNVSQKTIKVLKVQCWFNIEIFILKICGDYK